ncbi:invasion associated locus B family protein [Methylobacterium sp. Leaf94]|uniref:invasion associated locus B family protein n=1 Tax=Methylobacterium sp. Leaf94 TaxID=1736250 RepID=UPI000ABBF7E2|nr:invasion associated locus B family protein [Methylobacterium sp. Leaf94]
MTSLPKSIFGVLCFGLVCSGTGTSAQTSAPSLATAAVDTTLYREGEVRRRNERFGAWSLDCDEIVRLHRRFCSLRTLALSAGGTAIAKLTVSTDAKGNPAALISLPLGVDLSRPVDISPSMSLVLGKPSAAVELSTKEIFRQAKSLRTKNSSITTKILQAKVSISLCDQTGCHAVWSLSAADIAALRAGAEIRLSYDFNANFKGIFELPISYKFKSEIGIISSDGFGDAIQASLK